MSALPEKTAPPLSERTKAGIVANNAVKTKEYCHEKNLLCVV